MLWCCLKCRKNTESKNSKVVKTKNGRTMLLSKCEVCDIKKSKLIKEEKASRLLSSLGIKEGIVKKKFLSRSFKSIKKVNTRHEMNETANQFLWVGDKFMPEMHLRQPEFT